MNGLQNCYYLSRATSSNFLQQTILFTVDCNSLHHFLQHIIIIIMEICKVPTLRLKALNKHTLIMYIEMENVIKKEEGIDKGSSITMQKMHTHTHSTD